MGGCCVAARGPGTGRAAPRAGMMVAWAADMGLLMQCHARPCRLRAWSRADCRGCCSMRPPQTHCQGPHLQRRGLHALHILLQWLQSAWPSVPAVPGRGWQLLWRQQTTHAALAAALARASVAGFASSALIAPCTSRGQPGRHIGLDSGLCARRARPAELIQQRTARPSHSATPGRAPHLVQPVVPAVNDTLVPSASAAGPGEPGATFGSQPHQPIRGCQGPCFVPTQQEKTGWEQETQLASCGFKI